jgi:hypothetical protein
MEGLVFRTAKFRFSCLQNNSLVDVEYEFT